MLYAELKIKFWCLNNMSNEDDEELYEQYADMLDKLEVFLKSSKPPKITNYEIQE